MEGANTSWRGRRSEALTTRSRVALCAGAALITAAGATAGCSEGPEEEPPLQAASAASETGTFREDVATDFSGAVEGDATATMFFRRRGRLTYDVELRRGATNVAVFQPMGSRPINPFGAATYYPSLATTLVCVNAFADARGSSPLVRCRMVSDAGSVSAEVTASNAWLHDTTAGSPRALVTIGDFIDTSDPDGYSCRAIVYENASLRFDKVTPRSCDDGSAKAAGGVATRNIPPAAWGDEGSGGGDSGGGDSGGGDAGGGAPGPGPGPRIPEPPEALDECVPHSQMQEGSWNLGWSWGKTIADFPGVGLTTGFSVKGSTKGSVSSWPENCLDYEKYADGSLSVDVFLGKKGFSGYGSLTGLEKSCGDPECSATHISCNGGGQSRSKDSSISLGGQVTIPLDTWPALKPLCGHSFTSCNVDIGIDGSYSKGESDASGTSSCGSGCRGPNGATGESTWTKSEGGGISGEISGEIEIQLGKYAHGRVGISGGGSWAFSHSDGRLCGGRSALGGSECVRLDPVRAYFYGCLGNGWVSYCRDGEKQLLAGKTWGKCP